ncbi:MAG: hypothetical protein K2M69_01995 [Muribaculaceae bacterium]|nr:hypothetical protein [Muribaculaceae bacterium]
MKNRLNLALMAFVVVMIFCDFKYSNREGSEIPVDGQQMEILHYHGHTYVCYRFYEKGRIPLYEGGYGYGGASIVHDPDCKCGKGGGR